MNVAQPVEMQAPSAAYTVFYVIFALNLVGSVGWLAWRARTTRSGLPLAAAAGGLCAGVLLPPIYNALTLVWFPSNIPGTFITAFGMRDPSFDVIGYALFIGFGGWLLCEQLRAGRGARAVWETFVLWGVADLLFELPFLQWGMYRYYGDQPFLVGGFPAHWVLMNGAVPVIAGALMYALTDHWPFRTGPGPHVRVAATPLMAGGLLLVPMAPVAVALHADVASWVRSAAALASAAISLSVVRFIAAQAATAPQPAGRTAAAPALAGARS